MAHKEILLVAEVFSNEKDIDKEIVFEAMESALEAATIKRHTNQIKVRVIIDRKTGDYVTYRQWDVVDTNPEIDGDVEFPASQILLEAARMEDPNIQIGDVVQEEIESVEFGRIAAQTAKQVIIHKVREAERKKIVEAYHSRVGELITGIVKRIEKGNVFLDLGGHVEGYIAKEDMIPKEAIRNGDRIRGYLKDVRSEPRGPQLFISRTAPELLIALFRLEVPEVNEGMISIMGAARDPGSRAKIAVKGNDPRLDPVGACVGMRGSRVQSVTNELAGERIDIILWNPNEAQFVINAMAPAEIQSIVVDEDKHSMDLAVSSENLSQAIGRGGQNVRLATQLTGWELNVLDATKAEEKSEAEAIKIKQLFVDKLDVDDDIATILAEEGFNSVEEIAYVPISEMLEIEGFDEELVNELKTRAKDSLLFDEIVNEEKEELATPADDLIEMEGMDDDLAHKMVRKGILTMEDLAEQSVDDLLDLEGMTEAKAAQLIMKAREPWFVETSSE